MTENNYYVEYTDAQNQLKIERSNSSLLQQQIYDLENEINRLRGEIQEKWMMINDLEAENNKLKGMIPNW